MIEFPFRDRLVSVQKIINSHSLDGILFVGLENIRYLCGFTGSDGALIVTSKESFFLTDSRYWTQAEEEVKGSQIVHYKKKTDGIHAILSDLKVSKIGFESLTLPFFFYQSLSEKLAPQGTLIPLERELKNLRAINDAKELALIRKTIAIASNAFSSTIENVREGAFEREIALEMEFLMKRSGAESLGFDIIFASGKRSALPHGKAGAKRIEK